jgi:hypothetical protein
MAETTEFLPFHAINEFMRPDFRLALIRDTLSNQTKLNDPCSAALDQQIKKRVSVPGFRNSEKAPALIKVLPTSKAFENQPELVAAVLNCWSEIQHTLRDQVFEMLRLRNWPFFSEGEDLELSTLNLELIKEWPIFPIKMNRAKLPGFFIHWPKGEDFESLYANFSSLYPDSDMSLDKVSLMTVWLSMRLPYKVDVDLQKSSAEEGTGPTP